MMRVMRPDDDETGYSEHDREHLRVYALQCSVMLSGVCYVMLCDAVVSRAVRGSHHRDYVARVDGGSTCGESWDKRREVDGGAH
jgi:hypothetical protein